MNIEINIKVNANLFKALKQKPKELDRAVNIALQRSVDYISGQAKRAAPYKTGILRKSIDGRVRKARGKQVGTVGVSLASVPYARIQDIGGLAGRNRSARIKGNKYLTRSFMIATRGKIQKFFKEEILNVIK